MSDIRPILTERGANYGCFGSNARIAQDLKRTLRNAPMWREAPPYIQEALEMIAFKMARVVNGDYRHADNLIDIIGYTQLAIDQLEKEKTIDMSKDFRVV